MTLYDLIISRRTIREFLDTPVTRASLEKYVNAGRLAPQAANRQPLEFIVVDDWAVCNKIFPQIKLAGSLEWKPSADRQPRAYIAIIVKSGVQKPFWVPYDVALASENISLAAWEEGVGSCFIGAFNKKEIEGLLELPDGYDVDLLVAFGHPANRSVAEDMKGEDVQYRRDADGTFHVPKRPLKSILHFNKF